jgi:hypothetical protein
MKILILLMTLSLAAILPASANLFAGNCGLKQYILAHEPALSWSLQPGGWPTGVWETDKIGYHNAALTDLDKDDNGNPRWDGSDLVYEWAFGGDSDYWDDRGKSSDWTQPHSPWGTIPGVWRPYRTGIEGFILNKKRSIIGGPHDADEIHIGQHRVGHMCHCDIKWQVLVGGPAKEMEPDEVADGHQQREPPSGVWALVGYLKAGGMKPNDNAGEEKTTTKVWEDYEPEWQDVDPDAITYRRHWPEVVRDPVTQVWRDPNKMVTIGIKFKIFRKTLPEDEIPTHQLNNYYGLWGPKGGAVLIRGVMYFEDDPNEDRYFPCKDSEHEAKCYLNVPHDARRMIYELAPVLATDGLEIPLKDWRMSPRNMNP